MARLRRDVQLGMDDLDAGRSIEVNSAEGLAAMLDGCLENSLQKLAAQNAEPRA